MINQWALHPLWQRQHSDFQHKHETALMKLSDCTKLPARLSTRLITDWLIVPLSRFTIPILSPLTPAFKEPTVLAALVRSVFTDWMGWRSVCGKAVKQVAERTQWLFSSAICYIRVWVGDYFGLYWRCRSNRWRNLNFPQSLLLWQDMSKLEVNERLHIAGILARAQSKLVCFSVSEEENKRGFVAGIWSSFLKIGFEWRTDCKQSLTKTLHNASESINALL